MPSHTNAPRFAAAIFGCTAVMRARRPAPSWGHRIEHQTQFGLWSSSAAELDSSALRAILPGKLDSRKALVTMFFSLTNTLTQATGK